MNVKTTLTILTLSIGSIAVADGHLSGDAAVEARQAAMKAVGQAAKAGDFVAMNEAAIAAQAAFLPDTTGNATLPTKAAENIWSDPEGFAKVMSEMVDLSAAGDKSVFGTCKACHSAYRN